MNPSLRTIAWICCTGLWLQGSAQSAAGLQMKYPGEPAVLLDHTMHYTITVKDGQPIVQSKESQRLAYLSVQSGNDLSNYGFFHSDFHEIQQYSAYTLTADAKKIKVTDFKTTDSKSNGVFYDDIKETTFDFPAVAPGSIGTLETSMIDKNPRLLSPFYFALSVPVVHAELQLTFPKTMSIRYVLRGIDTSNVVFSQETRHGEIIYTFQANDMPGEKHYEDDPGLAWYGTQVIFYIEKFVDEQGKTVNYLASPDDLYHLYRGYIKDINKEAGPDLRHIVDSLCKNLHTEEEKARTIYSWVQQHIKYIAFEQGMEGYIPRDANLVCTRRFGDCKDMSSILTLMLRTAGINAWYTWIGTRDLPYNYTETPLPLVDNHMICTIRLHDQYIFLDGTDPYCVFGMPSIGIQDKQALVAIDDSSYKILTVPTPDKTVNQITDSTILDLTDVYMTVFLPAADAGRLAVGDEARIILDPVPDYVIPAKVSFVAADAQFTPKTVETTDERAKLMFRVKLKIDAQVLQQFYTRVKTGVRGLGFVRTKADLEWPPELQVKLPKPPADKASAAPAADSTKTPDNSAAETKTPDAK